MIIMKMQINQQLTYYFDKHQTIRYINIDHIEYIIFTIEWLHLAIFECLTKIIWVFIGHKHIFFEAYYSPIYIVWE